MTDQELIQLLQQKPPSEFSVQEYDALRARWTQSPELRQALIDHLHLESQLAGAFGQIDLDIDKILKRAADERRLSRSVRSPLWRWSVGLILLLALGLGVLFWPGRKPPGPELVDGPGNTTDTLDNPDTSSRLVVGVTDEEPADALIALAAHGASGADGSGTADRIPEVTRIDAAQPEADEPWTASLARDVAPWPLNSPKFTRDFIASGHDELPEAEARRWFSQIEGQPFNWGQDSYGQPRQRRVARFQGIGRLRAPWPDEALLRMTPFDVTDLTIYLWRGPTGVALRLYTRREPHTWAAFEVVRETSSPKPIRWGLLTTDNGSYVRAGTGTFDLRYQDGGIVLARGGVPLLTAPLPGRPDEVFVEGQFRLRGISIHRTAPLMSVPENPHPIVIGGAAGGLPWSASAETPAEMIAGPDGTAEFKVDSRDKPGTAILTLDQRGLYEVIARVDAADPGTGLFLGDLDGRPLHRVGYFKDGATGHTTLGILRPGETRDTAHYDINAFPPPYHTRGQWVKVIAGLGTAQILVSGDGRHWGHLTEDPARDLPGAVGSVGVFGLPGPAARTLRLASLEVRSLTGLTTLADPKLMTLAPQFTGDEWKDPVRWMHRAIDALPAETDLARWMAACEISALSQGPPREFGSAVLKRLVSASIHSDIPVDQKLLLLEEASLLCDLWEEVPANSFADHYGAIAEQLETRGDLQPLATIRPAVLRSPMWTKSRLRSAWESQSSRDLLRTTYRSDWQDALHASQAVTFWSANPHPDKAPVERADMLTRQARWVRAISIENAPQLDDGQAAVIPPSWRHPLALQWNKEAYNVRAELQSALTGQTYEDACRIVMSINVTDGPGLLPDMDDRQLFVSLPTAVAAAMQIHPDFANLMRDKFGPLGVIRVRHAIQSGDVRGVQAATLQFFGTEAAAEAHQWLGDRDLSGGRFPSAEEHFLLGLAHCLPGQREQLESRLRLALALNGKPLPDTATVPTKPIQFSGAEVSATELDSLIKAMAARPSAMRRFQLPPPVPVPALPPRAYRAETRGAFDGQPGLNPGRYEFRFGDPFGKQLAAVADSQRIYVSNRLQVNAYALPGGQQQWAQALGSDQGEAHALPFTPMPPLVAGDRLFVRRLGKGGTELACLNAENGQVVWAQRPNLHVLSDPVFWNGSLFALTLAKIDEDLVQVEGTRFDFETGAATSSQPLFRLRDSNERSDAVQLTISGRLAVCTLAGISACFDGSGEIHWLRRHLWLPKTVDDLSEDFRVTAPAILGDHVVVAVPGVRDVICMDLETGRQIWNRPQPDLRGIIGVHGSKVLLDTTRGLAALSLADGRLAWTRSLDTRLEAFHADDRMIVAAQRVTVAPNKTRPYLLWLDLESGQEVAQSQLDGFERPESQLGPFIFAGGKWWSLTGNGWKETRRELCELTAMSDRTPGSLMDTNDAWLPEIPLPQRADMALVLPGWRPVAFYGPRFELTTGDVRGETFVVSAKVEPAHEVRLLQVVEIPAGRKTTLRLRFGNSQDRQWALTVRAANQPLLEQLVEDAGSNNGWREAIVDLTPFAGQRIPVQLIQTIPPQQQPSAALWKRATVVVE